MHGAGNELYACVRGVGDRLGAAVQRGVGAAAGLPQVEAARIPRHEIA